MSCVGRASETENELAVAVLQLLCASARGRGGEPRGDQDESKAAPTRSCEVEESGGAVSWALARGRAG